MPKTLAVNLKNKKKMDTKITMSNVKSAIKDDKAHMSYLKRDVNDDQKAGGKYKDINQTAGDVKADHSFISKHMHKTK